MSHIVGRKRNIRTIKALRGESLTIDLGRTQTGTLEAWMKKNPNDTTFRAFEIRENRFLFLSKEKAQDYYNEDSSQVIEAIKGRWQFDVRVTPVGGTADDSTVIYTGTILFEDQVTGSRGVELTNPNIGIPTVFISLQDTPSSYGLPGQAVVVNETGDGLTFGESSGSSGDILKNNTLMLFNKQTITNGTQTFNYNKDEPAVNVFLELPKVSQGMIKGRLSVGTLQYIENENFDYTEVSPAIIEFETMFFDTARWIHDSRPTTEPDSTEVPLIGITRFSADADVAISTEYYGEDYSTIGTNGAGEEVPIVLNAFLEKTLPNNSSVYSVKFGSAELQTGVKSEGILFTLRSQDYIGIANSAFANLIEMLITFQDVNEVDEALFSDKEDYLTMLNTDQLASFSSYESVDFFKVRSTDGE